MTLNTTTKDFDWAAEVKRIEGESFFDPPAVYEFSNGRKFLEEEGPHGPYEYETIPT